MLRLIPRRRHRAYFVLAVGTVALAVGVNLVVFTIVNALWLRPLPFPDADRLVTIPFSSRTDARLQEIKIFEGAVGQVDENLLGLRPQIVFDEVGRDLEIAGVTPGFFGLFGLALQGRDFAPHDNLQGAEPVAIISHRLWSRDFGRRADLIGSVVPAKPVPLRVIGVAPPGFEGVRRGDRAEIWIPAELWRELAPTSLDLLSVPLLGFARLSPGQTTAEAQQRLFEAFPKSSHPGNWPVVPLADVFGTPTSPTIVIREGQVFSVVAGLALLVLAGGCATLAALVLVHYERRRLELATKVALGAPRARLIAELSRELAVIAIAGTLGAVLLVTFGLRVIPALSLPGGVDLSRLDLSLDWRVLSVAVGTTMVTLLVAAWWPMARFTRGGLASELRAGTVTASAASQRLRQVLLATQVSATVVVLISAGLFIRTVMHGFGQAPGFDVGRTVFITADVQPTGALTGTDDETMARWIAMANERQERIEEALRSLPGVESVADSAPPIGAEAMATLSRSRSVELQDGSHREMRVAWLSQVGPEFLSTLGVPIMAGRNLTAADRVMRPMPIVVTATLARQLWPTESPLGQDFMMGNEGSLFMMGSGGSRFVVVGVAADFVFGSLMQPAEGVVITGFHTSYGNRGRWALRTTHPEVVASQAPAAIRAAVADAARVRVSTGRDLIAEDLGRQRLGAWFFSGFGLVALLLGVGGVFGLVAYLAESQHREFGVRLALGATPSNLVRHGMLVAVVPVGIGLVVGLFLAAVVARVFASLLLGVSPLDPVTYAAIAVTMLGAAVLASLGAAWRLRRMAPTDALRSS